MIFPASSMLIGKIPATFEKIGGWRWYSHSIPYHSHYIHIIVDLRSIYTYSYCCEVSKHAIQCASERLPALDSYPSNTATFSNRCNIAGGCWPQKGHWDEGYNLLGVRCLKLLQLLQFQLQLPALAALASPGSSPGRLIGCGSSDGPGVGWKFFL